MTTEQIIFEKIHQMPDYMQIQVNDYIDFLMLKYPTKSSEEEEGICAEHEQILRTRYEKYKNNPSAGSSWDEIKTRLMNKYAV